MDELLLSEKGVKGLRELIRDRINTYVEAPPSPSFFYDQFLGGRKETNDRVDDSGTLCESTTKYLNTLK